MSEEQTEHREGLPQGASGYVRGCRCQGCREGARDGARRRAAVKRAALDEIKLERGCVDCGYTEHAVALDFDHREAATKQFGIGSGLGGRSWTSILDEVEKCDVRCANCHRVRTAKQLGWNHD